jgi:hypothetical protein
VVQSLNIFCVYFHYRKSDGNLFYIGFGKPSRPYDFQHRGPVWKRVFKKHGVFVKVPYSGLSKTEASKLEFEMIQKYKPSCNFAPGGFGGDVWSSMSKSKQESIREKQKVSVWNQPFSVRKTQIS